MSSVSMPSKNVDAEDAPLCNVEGGTDLTQLELEVDQNLVDENSSIKSIGEGNLSSAPIDNESALEGDSEDVELGNFFTEDASARDVLPAELLDLQKKERHRELYSEKNFGKLEGIWKKVICVFYDNSKKFHKLNVKVLAHSVVITW